MTITEIYNVNIVNEGTVSRGSVVIGDDRILYVGPERYKGDAGTYARIDGEEAYLLPGAIDAHVHCREPGMTDKGDICCESKAAVAGGVTTIFDMPNTLPPTTTMARWEDKMERAARTCFANYAFYVGASEQNYQDVASMVNDHIPGIKIFLSPSTGGLLLEGDGELRHVFREARLPIVAHCEDTDIIRENTARLVARLGKSLPVSAHSEIRNVESCAKAVERALSLARETGAQLHIAHISSKKELELLSRKPSNVTAEACLPHLLLDTTNYVGGDMSLKCNPALKAPEDKTALQHALQEGPIDSIGSDHAPHLRSDKQHEYTLAPAGMPSIEVFVPAVLGLTGRGGMTIERAVELMSHKPARIFHAKDRGFIREGYKADLVMVEHVPYTLDMTGIRSKCQWSPFAGTTFQWRVKRTFVNGRCIYQFAGDITERAAEPITFDR